MSTEPRQVTKPAAWTAWENQVINGVFPLRRFLATSRHGVVFLTEYRGASAAPINAAIKLVPADAARADALLAQWQAAAAIAHPNLIRLFDVGRCQLSGRGFAFVVMEHAEQTLAQILAKRALTAEEARELLPPALDALACLHRNQFVHGQVKPSNFLAVDDQLKLSTDSARHAGRAENGIVRTSLYDPPELREGIISAAGDMWALGMTLVEALTQRTWAGSRGQFETTTSLLASLPAPFSETARRCLSRAPADRPSAAELEAQYRPASPDALIADELLSVTPSPIESPRPSEPTETIEARTAETADAPLTSQPHEAVDLQQPTPEPQEAIDTQQPTHEAYEIVDAESVTLDPQEVAEVLTKAVTPRTSEAPEIAEAAAAETQDPAAAPQTAGEAAGDSNAPQNLSLASLSLRAIAGAFLLFLGAWAILHS